MSISSSGVPQKLDEKLELVKFSSIAWTHDNKGFFYNRCDFPGAASWSLVKIC
jgi:prolyl oligopeptidase